jgi:hypothetical protein
MDLATFFAQHPFTSAFVFGVVAAARNDYIQYKKSHAEIVTDEQLTAAIRTFNWKVAAIRWFHGGIAAWITALGAASLLPAVPGLF